MLQVVTSRFRSKHLKNETIQGWVRKEISLTWNQIQNLDNMFYV